MRSSRPERVRPMCAFAIIVTTISLTIFIISALGAVPNPVVTGPIPAAAPPGDPSHNYPFFASQFDLAARGYVEEEFFIEGTANRYNTPANPIGTATIIDGGHPYKTRIVVRRPASSANFNGIVLVEWTNVTNGWDMENTWFQIYEHVLRSGWAWVGVSAQRVGVNYLKTWNAGRYGTLNVDYTSTTPPTTDGLRYDIFSQAVQAIRNPSGINPLGNLNPEVIIATGHSQSASNLATYANSIQPLAQVIDAFALHGSLGNRIRTDLEVPVWKVLSEFDVQGSEARVRRPDDQLFATWEVTGTSHNDWQSYQSRVFLQNRDKPPAVELSFDCTVDPFGSKVPFHYVMSAGLDHLVRWVKGGTSMPSAPPIEVQSFGPPGPTVLARDPSLINPPTGFGGIARGGIRLSQVEVPIAESVGTQSGTGTCSRWGYTVPYDDATLKSLYRNHGNYVSQVTNVTEENLLMGYILPADADQTIEDAAHSSIGKKK